MRAYIYTSNIIQTEQVICIYLRWGESEREREGEREEKEREREVDVYKEAQKSKGVHGRGWRNEMM